MVHGGGVNGKEGGGGNIWCMEVGLVMHSAGKWCMGESAV